MRGEASTRGTGTAAAGGWIAGCSTRVAWAAWSRVAEPTDRDAWHLIDALGAREALAWIAAPEAIDGTGRPGVAAAVARWRPRLAVLDPYRELATIERLGGAFLPPDAPGYPPGLSDLGERRPFGLWVVGDASQRELGGLCRRSIAIVGSRAASAYGTRIATEWAHEFAGRGYTVVSGGAYGIDAAAHRGVLAARGPTIALMAGGLDKLYPPGNTALLREIAAAGALVAEVPPGSAHYRARFLQRNRLIAAMAQAVVVVEAGWRSGALSTAHHAAELLRPVGAVPGPITAPSSAGCHRLLRDGGAVCVTEPAEVIELIESAPVAEPHAPATLFDDLGPNETRVVEALPLRRPASIEAIARAAGLDPAGTLAALGRLELAGLAMRAGPGWRRAPDAGRR